MLSFLNPENKIKEEKNQKNINNEDSPPQPKDTEDDVEVQNTEVYLNIDDITEDKEQKNIEKDEKDVKKVNKNNSTHIKESLNQLNNSDLQNKNRDNEKSNNRNNNQSFMQRTKSLMSNMWTNIKNYNYSKYNIFKRTEMEDILDAHGNHMKIPKNRKDKPLKRIKTDVKEGSSLKFGNLNYNTYYTSSNVNVFSGYPF